MITGAFLLDSDKRISYRNIWKRYIRKVIKVLFTFGFVFAIMEIVFEKHFISIGVLCGAMKNVIAGNTWAHMWYLYMLLGLYIMLPVYRLLTKVATEEELLYTAWILFIFLSVVVLLKNAGIEFGVMIPLNSIYPLYLLLGYMINKSLLKVSVRVSGIVLVICNILIVLLSILSIRLNYPFLMDLVSHYEGPIVVLESICIFRLFKDVKRINCKSCHIILKEVADKSFGIYIVHMFFVNVFYKVLHINPVNYPLGSGVLLLGIVNVILSYGVVTIIKKIPYVRALI